MDILMSSPLVYYGGTFDPIHQGHLNICKSINQIFNFDKITILPNNIPPHRPQPLASSTQRLKMIELAIKKESLFSLDTRELSRQSYSYSIDTLIELRSEYGDRRPIYFIIGEDSLYSINKWHQWERLLDYCHLLVCKRHQQKLISTDNNLTTWLEHHITSQHTVLQAMPHGKIYLAQTPYYDISATQIRGLIRENKQCEPFLHAEVLKYIKEQRLYL